MMNLMRFMRYHRAQTLPNYIYKNKLASPVRIDILHQFLYWFNIFTGIRLGRILLPGGREAKHPTQPKKKTKVKYSQQTKIQREC